MRVKTAKLFHLSSDELLWGFHEVNWWSRGPPAIALNHFQESGDLFEMCWREFYIRSVFFFCCCEKLENCCNVWGGKIRNVAYLFKHLFIWKLFHSGAIKYTKNLYKTPEDLLCSLSFHQQWDGELLWRLMTFFLHSKNCSCCYKTSKLIMF